MNRGYLHFFFPETNGQILISQKCSLGDLFQKLIMKFWCVKKHGFGEWWLLILYWHEETTGQILKWFHRNVPWVTLCKNCSRNFDLSINMALVCGGYVHYTDIKKFFRILLLGNCRQKRFGCGPLKNSGERSMAVLALIFVDSFFRHSCTYICKNLLPIF